MVRAYRCRIVVMARHSRGIVDRRPDGATICFNERIRRKRWGGRWDSNPRQPRSQPGALPAELRPPSFTQATNLARPAGVEPATTGLEGRCSIQLSYGRTAGRRLPDSRLDLIGWSGQQDSNLRPSAPKADALPDCAMPRFADAAHPGLPSWARRTGRESYPSRRRRGQMRGVMPAASWSRRPACPRESHPPRPARRESGPIPPSSSPCAPRDGRRCGHRCPRRPCHRPPLPP